MSLAALAAGVSAVLAPAWLVGLTGFEGEWQAGVARGQAGNLWAAGVV